MKLQYNRIFIGSRLASAVADLAGMTNCDAFFLGGEKRGPYGQTSLFFLGRADGRLQAHKLPLWAVGVEIVPKIVPKFD